MIITNNFTMALDRRGVAPVVDVSQDDSHTRAVEISLTYKGQPWQIPDGTTAAIRFKKPDGRMGLYDTLPDSNAAYTISGNVVTVTLAPEVLTAEGRVDAAVALYKGTEVLGLFPFVVSVAPNPAGSQSVSNNYYYLQTWDDVNEANMELRGRVDDLLSRLNKLAEETDLSFFNVNEICMGLKTRIANLEKSTSQGFDDVNAEAATVRSQVNDLGKAMGQGFRLVNEAVNDLHERVSDLEKAAPDSSKNVDYSKVENKPKINGVELYGDKSLEELGIGTPTDKQVEESVDAWLNKHPEATTTVQNGSITEEKLSDDLKKSIKNAANSTALTMKVVGRLFAKPEDRKYVAWALGNVQYDAAEDTVNVLVNVADTHEMTNDENVPDLYLFKMNPHTMAYTLEPIVKDGAVVNQTNADAVTFVPGTKCAYTYGFCIDSKGDYLFIPNYCAEMYLFRSSDHGASWSVTACTKNGTGGGTTYTGLMQTSTGRLIVSTQSSYFHYSDDNGKTWTLCATPTNHTYGHEACIVELAENELLAVMRKRWNHSDFGSNQVEAAFVCYSHDNGATWTNGVDSKTITEMSLTGCAIAKIGDRVELYATSRYSHLDTYGVIYQHAASVEDALADNWSNGKVLTYAKAKHPDDFGYPGCCVDGNGNVHLFWYDGDADERASTNYYYAQGYSGVANVPVNSDDFAIDSMAIPFSAAKTRNLLAALKAQLMGKINQLIIDGGGVPEVDEDSVTDGSFYVVDGLYEYVDFLNESKYDVETGVYSGAYGNINMTGAAGAAFNPLGRRGAATCKTDLSADLKPETGVTLEFEVYVDTGSVAGNNNVYPFVVGQTNGNAGSFQIFNNGKLNVSYKKTDDTTTSFWGTDVYNKFIFNQPGYWHIVATIDSNAVNVYFNGALKQSAEGSAITNFAEWNVAFTGFLINAGWGDAQLNYARVMRVYNRALTAEEVKNNYTYQVALRE